MPAANMTAEPGTITPQDIPVESENDSKAKGEAQAANQQQQQKKPPPPRPPVQAQPAQRSFFPFGFFR